MQIGIRYCTSCQVSCEFRQHALQSRLQHCRLIISKRNDLASLIFISLLLICTNYVFVLVNYYVNIMYLCRVISIRKYILGVWRSPKDLSPLTATWPCSLTRTVFLGPLIIRLIVLCH